MHEVCDLVYKLLYSPRQCLCGELREIEGVCRKNQMNVKRTLKNSCESNSPPEIIPTLPFVKAEHGKKKERKRSFKHLYLFLKAQPNGVLTKEKRLSPLRAAGGGWSRMTMSCSPAPCPRVPPATTGASVQSQPWHPAGPRLMNVPAAPAVPFISASPNPIKNLPAPALRDGKAAPLYFSEGWHAGCSQGKATAKLGVNHRGE